MNEIQILQKYLPKEIHDYLHKYKNQITEIRIRREKMMCLTLAQGQCGNYGFGENVETPLFINNAAMDQIVVSFCQNSLYSHMESMTEGYIVLKEGIRIGVSGKAVCDANKIKSLSSVNSLNIRIPHFIFNISLEIYTYLEKNNFSKSAWQC